MPPIPPLPFALAAGSLFGVALLLLALHPVLPVQRPRATLALLALLGAAALAALLRIDPPGLRLALDPSSDALLPRGDPGRAAYQEAVRNFGNDEVFVIALRDERGFTRETLLALRDLRDALRRLEGVQSVRTLLDAYTFHYDPVEDWVSIRPFAETIPESADAIDALRRRALADPVFRRTLISEDGHSFALNLTLRPMSDAEFLARDIDETIAQQIAAFAAPGRSFASAGRPHAKARVHRLMLQDLQRLVPLALVVMGVSVWIAFGTRRAVLVVLGTALVASLWTFGALAAIGRPLTLLTTLLGPTLIALGCVTAVHSYARWEEEIERGCTPREAAARSAVALRGAILVASLTTLIGFGTLLTSDVPAVFELGAFSLFGVSAIASIAMSGLPALLALLPPPAPRPPWCKRLADRLEQRLAHIVRVASRRRVAIRSSAGALALLAALAIPRIVVDTDYLSYFDADDPVRRDFERVGQSLSGAIPVYVALGGEPGAFREPALLERVAALQRALDALPGVDRTLSFLDTLRPLNRALAGGAPEHERIPATREGVSELLFLLPKGELGRFVNVNHGRMNLLLRSSEVGSAATRRLTQSIETEIARAGLPDDLDVAITGNALLLNRSADGIANSQPVSMAATALATFAVATLALRSLPLGLLAMLPNLLPVLLFFGLLGAGLAPLSLPTSLIGSIALGLAIDDTAHFLFRYRAERRAGRDPEQALHETGRHVGRPIAITSALLCIGFGLIGLSGFATLRDFGLITALTFALCALADLFLLPALLARGASVSDQ